MEHDNCVVVLIAKFFKMREFVNGRNKCEELDLEFICHKYDGVPTYGFDNFKAPYVDTHWEYKPEYLNLLLGILELFMPKYKLTTHYVELFSDAAFYFRFFNKETNIMYAWSVSDMALIITPNLLLSKEFELIISKKPMRLGARFI